MRNGIYILCMAFVLSACSVTSGVPEGDQLYTGLTDIAYENYEDNEHASLMKEEVGTALEAAPNGALLGSSYHRFPLPFNLMVWNKFHNSEDGIGKWITSSFGKEPVLMSRVNPELRATVAQSVLRSHGYFNAKVDHQEVTKRNPKKAKIGYNVNLGHLWTIDSISYLGFPTGCDTLIHNSLNEAYISRGKPFDVTTLHNERNRISELLRNNGYYFYQPSYSYYLADTVAVPGKAQLRFQMAEDVPEEAKRQWYIGKVTVSLRRRMMETLDSMRNMRRLSLAFNNSRPRVRPRVLMGNISLNRGELYNNAKYQESAEKMRTLGIFSMVDFQFVPRDSTETCDSLDVNVNCVFERPYDFYVETRATGSSVGRLGPELVVGLSKRNAFRGGEKLDISLHGSYAWQVNGGHNNYYEYGYDFSLEYPRIVAPFFGSNRSRRGAQGNRRRRRQFYATPTTMARLSNNVINRPGYFNMNTITAEWTYRWQTTATSRFLFSPFTLQYQFKNSVTDDFFKAQNSRNYVSAFLEDKLVPQMRFSYIYSSPSTYRNPIVWEMTISEAANLISAGMMVFGKKWNEKDKKLYKATYSQFVKLETDFTKTWHVGENSTLVAHVNLGYLPTYGNCELDEAPYSEYFYVGGASSLRAWPARGIGPSDMYIPGNSSELSIFRILRIGTIKSVFNLEYRPRLVKNLYGAIFLDAGNVWNRQNYADEDTWDDIPEEEITDGMRELVEILSTGKFKLSRLGNDLALNTGVGLRYDFGFITLRLDWGLGLHVPYRTDRSGYFNAKTFGRDQSLHFAVGLPF